MYIGQALHGYIIKSDCLTFAKEFKFQSTHSGSLLCRYHKLYSIFRHLCSQGELFGYISNSSCLISENRTQLTCPCGLSIKGQFIGILGQKLKSGLCQFGTLSTNCHGISTVCCAAHSTFCRPITKLAITLVKCSVIDMLAACERFFCRSLLAALNLSICQSDYAYIIYIYASQRATQIHLQSCSRVGIRSHSEFIGKCLLRGGQCCCNSAVICFPCIVRISLGSHNHLSSARYIRPGIKGDTIGIALCQRNILNQLDIVIIGTLLCHINLCDTVCHFNGCICPCTGIDS